MAVVGPLPGLGVPACRLRGVAHPGGASEQAYRLDVCSRRDLRVQRKRRLDARVAGIARREALDLGAHDTEGGAVLAAQGQQLELAAGVLEEAALACKDVHRPGHPLPGCQGTEHAVAGVVGRGGRLPVGDLPAAMAWRIWARVRPNRREAAAAAITWKLALPQPRLTPWEALSDRPKSMS